MSYVSQVPDDVVRAVQAALDEEYVGYRPQVTASMLGASSRLTATLRTGSGRYALSLEFHDYEFARLGEEDRARRWGQIPIYLLSVLHDMRPVWDRGPDTTGG